MIATLPAAVRSRSRARRTALVTHAAIALSILLTSTAAAQGAPTGTDALIDALARVPGSAATSDSLISYVDYRAVEAARPGALAPASLEEVLALQDVADPAAARWFAATMGIASGPSHLLTDLLSQGPTWPESVGFDFTDIDRAVAFGVPPSDGTVLVGDFDPDAIAAAFAARGFTSTPVGDHVLLCGPDGCDSGLDIDLQNLDPSVPFGGRLGRREPLAVSPTDLLSSADSQTVEAMLATASGDAQGLAGDPAFRAVAAAPADDLTIIQATLLPGALVVGGPDVAAMIGATPEQVEAIVAEFDALEPLAQPAAVAIVDGASPTEQVVTIALAYADEEEAERAADAVSERLETVRSLVRDEPLRVLLDERGVTGIATRVEPPGEGTTAAAVVELRAPLAGDEPDDSGRLTASSMLYRLFVNLIQTRDLHWLVPTE